MSRAINVFVSSDIEFKKLKSLTSKIFDVDFKKVELDVGVIYEAYDESKEMRVNMYENHGLENDRDMNFEDFLFQVNFESKHGSRQAELNMARRLVETLRQIESVKVMMVDDVQNIVT